MSYEQKYKSYKEKYLKLKDQLDQNGGYRFNDSTKEKYMLSLLLKYLESYDDIFYLYPNDDEDPLEDSERLEYNQGKLGYDIERLLSDEYSTLLETFIRQYTDDTVYIQPFDDKTSPSPDTHPYHVNFGSLMFMSFILEYELFSLTHHLCKSNFISYVGGHVQLAKHNNIKSIFNRGTTVGSSSSVDDYRCYNNIVHKLPHNLLIKGFANNMDALFEDFMDAFVTRCSEYLGRNKMDVYKAIVPVNYPPHKQNTYDFIYKNWKDRIGGDIEKINLIIKETMDMILNSGTKYINEATGFFSYMHLVDRINYTKKFGSCITFTMIEMYIMSRLHTHGDNMYLQLEVEKQASGYAKHELWLQTANFLKMHCEAVCQPKCCFTHWTSKFKIFGGDIQFRSAFKSNGSELQFSTQKDKIFYALILPIYDSYHQYLLNMRMTHEYDDKSISDILTFIDRRSMRLTSLIEYYTKVGIITANTKPYYKTRMEDMVVSIKTMNPTTIVDAVSDLGALHIPYLKFINMNQLCSSGESLLYRVAVSGNYTFFSHMMKHHNITTDESKNIDEINITIKNVSGDDVLDGIIYCNDDKTKTFYVEGKVLILTNLFRYMRITAERRDDLIRQLETNPGLSSHYVRYRIEGLFEMMAQ